MGLWGEETAGEYLRQKGYRLIAHSWRTRYGEIDLIAQKGQFLVFAEVKLRKNDHFAQAMEFVDSRKQQKLRITAELYLAQNPTNLQPRFDVIEIYAPEGEKTPMPRINHLEDAF